MGVLADKVGRKKTLLWCNVAMVVVNSLSAIVESFRWYLLYRFLDGFFCSGNILASFVLVNELVGASKRGLIGTAIPVSTKQIKRILEQALIFRE